MTFGRITALLAAIFAASVALILAFPDIRWILPVRAAVEAEGIDGLFRLMLIVSFGIFIFVQGFLLYFVWLYRRRPDDDPEAVGRALHGDNRLEIAWTVAPALFLVVLTIMSYQTFRELRLDEENVPGAHQVNVEAFQFAWRFEHPETGIVENNVLTLPKGVPTTLHITSRDVIHSFWVPEFRIKQDATPGYRRSITITPSMTHEEAELMGEGRTPPGFPLRCAELCGVGHSNMIAVVQVLEPAAYEAWEAEKLEALANAGGPPPGATEEELIEYGAQVYQEQGCGGCHVLDAVGAAGVVGPTHNNLSEQAGLRINLPDYTGSAQTTEEYLIESIRHPSDYVVDGYPAVMSPYGEDTISEPSLDALIMFLMQQ